MANETRKPTIAADVLESFRGRAMDAQRRAAESLCSLSKARLACTVCGVEQMLTIEKTLEYLANGWPCHCDREMVIRTGAPR